VYLPQGGVGIVWIKDALAQPDAGTVRAGALVHRCLDPLARWRIRYDGDLTVIDNPADVPRVAAGKAAAGPSRRASLDLVFAGMHAPFFYPDYRRVRHAPPHHRNGRGGWIRSLRRARRLPHDIRLALRMRSGRHYEQSLRVRGTIVVGDRVMVIDGGGHRDHSWGLRHWGVMPRLRWLTGQMEEFAFNAVYLTIAGSHVINGYVWHDARCTAVDGLALRTTFDDTNLAGREVSLDLFTGGERFHVEGDVVTNVPLPIEGKDFRTMYTVGRTRYRFDGRAGWGVAEFLERIEP
jgi:hypothetical protein